MKQVLSGMLRYPVIIREALNVDSAGVTHYADPIYTKTFFYGENKLVYNGVSVAMQNRRTLIMGPDVAIKPEDMVIIESGRPNIFGRIFESLSERDKYYEKGGLYPDKTWCIVGRDIWNYTESGWTKDYVWSEKVDGELVSNFQGQQYEVKSVNPYMRGMWDVENDDLVLQEVIL